MKNSREDADASIARRNTAAEAPRIIEKASGQGWTIAEIARGRLLIDEGALRLDADREMPRA